MKEKQLPRMIAICRNCGYSQAVTVWQGRSRWQCTQCGKRNEILLL